MKKKCFFVLLLTIAMTTIQAQNPFFSAYKTPYDTPPFNKIKNEHYEPAIEKGIAEHQAEINKIVMIRAVPTFENTIVPLEESGKLLSRVTSVFFNLLSSESNDEMMEIAQRIQPKLSEHSNSITLNEGLFQKVKAVYDKRLESNLTPEQIRLVEKTYRGFENSGATLVGKDRDTYKELSTKLSQLTLDFGQNALKESNKFEMLLTDEADLAGLPQMVKDAAAAKAKAKGKEGYIFDLSAPSYIAFMKYSTRRDLRQKLYMAYNTKCVAGGEFDNQENVKEIAKTRMQIANLLGYPDYATYTLRNKMAKDKEHVYGLLDDLFSAYAQAAREDVKMVEGFAVGMEGKAIDLQPWDWSFYSEKLKDAKYSVSDELVRPYFELENVKKGVFGLATDLYGITFKKNTKIQVYHPEVEAFDVLDEKGNFLAVLYTDFHPREGKRQGAWMSEFKGQYVEKGKDSRPFVTIVMNFTRPTETEPALLTFDEVETFLHEFGHALHGMLTKCTYETLSGTNVLHDFVELPSQIMENWLTEKEYLDKFAVHYKTGEKIPADLVKKLVDAANYNAGYLCYRQLSFGYLDMAWHTLEQPYTGDVISFERKAMDKTALLPVVEGTNMSTSFSHIFAGGYAAGYYGYKWAEVLDADAFALFKQTGIFNKDTARSFRENILEKGNTEEPMTLYVKFRGQEPTVNALLERNGIKK
ncbi:M3 family metallopeptidase [Dysgonomonas mossii]|uniref:oligopeptidase A n=2 Tax=Dysgonomonas mossii TaxID=163665 RepID=A0A4Y9IQQ5_9BACT|nr:M3 family metallopeptidase [Dysgonomonas mossii]MBF0761193.1 M3 family metallopeptidase [Dysgonomonas mossii]MBS5906453.1 M3 family metallopeptidase [Dysgonomonas mossii]TFU90149.1 M3 family peptidase [Dysgonomonas mossii]